MERTADASVVSKGCFYDKCKEPADGTGQVFIQHTGQEGKNHPIHINCFRRLIQEHQPGDNRPCYNPECIAKYLMLSILQLGKLDIEPNPGAQQTMAINTMLGLNAEWLSYRERLETLRKDCLNKELSQNDRDVLKKLGRDQKKIDAGVGQTLERIMTMTGLDRFDPNKNGLTWYRKSVDEFNEGLERLEKDLSKKESVKS